MNFSRVFISWILLSSFCVNIITNAKVAVKNIGKDDEDVIPSSDWDCKWKFQKEGRGCTPSKYCEYHYQFLDATLSESCRMKTRKMVKHVVSDGIQVHPGHALAGAGALFAGDIGLILFTPVLEKFPLLFNVIQGFILFVSGDTLFQVIEQGWHKKIGIKMWRMIRSGLIGALNNGFIHYNYYKWIDKNFPYHRFTKRFGHPESTLYKLVVANVKYWIEWPTIGAYKIASMYFFVALMGGELKGLAEKFRKRFWLTMFRALQVWPLYDTLLYAYVPAVQRPLFNTFMSILWGGYLSHISQAEGVLEGEDTH